MWLSVISMGLVYGGMISEASLFVQYGCYEPVEIDMGPSITPANVATVKTELECSVMCTRDDLCLSFYYGNSKCGLFHTVEESLEEMLEHTYYRKCQPKTKSTATDVATTTEPPKLCDKCPSGNLKTIYASENAAHVVCENAIEWPNSSEACACAGGRLINILDQKDQKYVEEIIKDVTGNGASLDRLWIGISGTAHGRDQPFNFKRSNGETLTDTSKYFSKWLDGEPDDNNEVGIGMIVSEGGDFGKWIDKPFNVYHSYVCEFVNL